MAVYSCEVLRDRLDAYVDGELSEAETRAVQGHLAACPRCAGPVAFERALHIGLKRRLRDARVPPGLWRRVRSALEHRTAGDGAPQDEATQARSEG